jgi:hypothetical protein
MPDLGRGVIAHMRQELRWRRGGARVGWQVRSRRGGPVAGERPRVRPRGVDDAPLVMALTLARLDALTAASFRALGPEGRVLGSTDWLIEGRARRSFGPSADGDRGAPSAILGNCFFVLAGTPLPKVRLY